MITIENNGKFAKIDEGRFNFLQRTGHFKGWKKVVTESDRLWAELEKRAMKPKELQKELLPAIGDMTMPEIKRLLDSKGISYDKKCKNKIKLYHILKNF